ncbi:uncharacterized protein BJ171DRAFT_557680 [Polychytrium aggregatum]|uniref:uncharacterized protein n=1 Tax=Polychytrium aggregatum TaxID=110093 RepID=UPI0022FE6EDD|nr:uncharacterized protein BJ171DRAFT_557680 [Polychytrium aggregatum]KAI9209100.1 hypothetical protein BJ171DRAFT_557680 [Polychytrium aggregatum]
MEIKALRKSGKKKVAQFYEEQNELIEELLKPIDYKDEDEEARLLKLKIAVYGSVGANVLLFFLQLYAALASKSLSLFATMADAFMDLASSLVLLLAAHAATKKDLHRYPTGKTKLETAGIIVFSSLMATVSFQLIVESIRNLSQQSTDVDVSPVGLTCVGVALATKAGLFLYCSALSQYQSARVLATDHRNDIIVNGFGIAASVIGKYYLWWIDPVGCILIALLILRSWTQTAWEHICKIVGETAEVPFLKKCTYVALTHDPRIDQVDTCYAYHSGDKFFVEVDVVLNADMKLREAHDIGESLQMKFESLSDVDRAFVHLDFESAHTPEHREKDKRSM